MSVGWWSPSQIMMTVFDFQQQSSFKLPCLLNACVCCQANASEILSLIQLLFFCESMDQSTGNANFSRITKLGLGMRLC